MPSKRTTTAPSPRRAPRKRIAESSPEPIVNASEKRKLILAHAAMRDTRDPQQIVSVWAGAVAVFAVFLVGWWWLAKPAYTQLLAKPSDPGIAEVKQITAEFGAHTKQDLEEATARLAALATQVDRDQRTLDLMAKIVKKSATSTLFVVASSTTDTATSTPTLKKTHRTYAQ